MEGVACGPAVEEEADGHGEGRPDHGQEAVFRLQLPAGGFGQEDLVGEDAEDDEADDVADTQAEVDEAGDADGKVVVFAKNDGESGEEEVEVAVDDGHEEREEENDGGEEKHLQRTDEGVAPELAGGEALVVYGTQSYIPRLGLQRACFASQYHDAVGLSHEDEIHNRDCSLLLACTTVSHADTEADRRNMERS